MAKLSPKQVAALALDAGLSEQQAVIAVAVARYESGYRTDAVGDQHLTNAKWGPSYGLWQIRSLRNQRGTGKERDATRLKDPEFNANSMRIISSRGTNWNPWTVYKNGSYRNALPEARKAVQETGGSNRNMDWLREAMRDDLESEPAPGTSEWFEHHQDIAGDTLGGRAADRASQWVAEALGIPDLKLVPWVLLGIALGVVGVIAILIDVAGTTVLKQAVSRG